MNKKPLIVILSLTFILLLSAFYSSSHAGIFNVFGPKTYIREKGKPEKITETFYVRSIAGNYKLIVENGLYTETEEDDNNDEKKKGKDKEKDKEEKKTRVSSAEIKINGKEIVKEHDFNKKVVRIEKTVLLNHGNNIIEVEVKSGPGAFITVKIEGEDGTPPDVTITSPANNTYLNTPSITVTGNTSDSISWVDSVKVNETTAQLQGNSYTASNINLTEGVNTITVAATDTAGNIGSASVTVILDTIPPQITLDPVPSITNKPQLTITGRVADASPITSLTINGTPVSLTNNTFTTTLNLTEGNNPIT
ncbi:MAG: Ig-like domain-containing protein, partial [Nitrospinae bacterium]|nr:Ig-like domain-containing protein [Nitrospinota bacterium]